MTSELAIVWRPGHRFGRPTIGETNIEAEFVAALVWAGDPVDDLAEDYEITVHQVELACWFVAHNRPWTNASTAWRAWAEQWGLWAWNTTIPRMPYPGPPPAEGN